MNRDKKTNNPNPPFEIHQTWRRKDYNWETRKLNQYPIVYARQTWYEKSVMIKREVWIEWIKKGWLSVSDQLKDWLDNNGYADILIKSHIERL